MCENFKALGFNQNLSIFFCVQNKKKKIPSFFRNCKIYFVKQLFFFHNTSLNLDNYHGRKEKDPKFTKEIITSKFKYIWDI